MGSNMVNEYEGFEWDIILMLGNGNLNWFVMFVLGSFGVSGCKY